jgi:hypothetical protein
MKKLLQKFKKWWYNHDKDIEKLSQGKKEMLMRIVCR